MTHNDLVKLSANLGCYDAKECPDTCSITTIATSSGKDGYNGLIFRDVNTGQFYAVLTRSTLLYKYL